MLSQRSAIDGLTGVAKRRRFDQALAQEWRRCLREQSQLAVVRVDIDHCKAYNDCYGRLAGDDGLRLVAAAMRQPLHRDADPVARLGGEGFAALLPDTEAEGAMAIAEQLRVSVAAFRIAHAASPTAACVTARVGAAAMRP